jgi:hypothetical protein
VNLYDRIRAAFDEETKDGEGPMDPPLSDAEIDEMIEAFQKHGILLVAVDS